MKTFLQIATEVGELVEQKNAAYGDSFRKSGDFLRLLFPNGVSPDKYDDLLLLFGVSKHTIAAILHGVTWNGPEKEKADECTSAESLAATTPPKARTASARKPAANKCTRTISRSNGEESGTGSSAVPPVASSNRNRGRR